MINLENYDQLTLKDIDKVSSSIVFVLDCLSDKHNHELIEVEDWSDDFMSIFTDRGSYTTQPDTPIYIKKSSNVIKFPYQCKHGFDEVGENSESDVKILYGCNCGSRFFIINLNKNIECVSCGGLISISTLNKNIDFINTPTDEC